MFFRVSSVIFPEADQADSRQKHGRALETSDAYRQFQSEGEAANISEFDFRSMLLCTMESSPATLNSNLEQFKKETGDEVAAFKVG